MSAESDTNKSEPRGSSGVLIQRLQAVREQLVQHPILSGLDQLKIDCQASSGKS